MYAGWRQVVYSVASMAASLPIPAFVFVYKVIYNAMWPYGDLVWNFRKTTMRYPAVLKQNSALL